jgi:hypothetical protein
MGFLADLKQTTNEPLGFPIGGPRELWLEARDREGMAFG